MKNALKRSFSVFLAVTFILSSAFVGFNELDFSRFFAVDAKAASESDLTFELSDDGKSYAVADCNSYAIGEIIIPDTYNGLPVTSISDYAFRGCTSITSVTIGDSVNSIGDYAFEDCASITSVTIGDSVNSIDDASFEGCVSLISITIPDSVVSIGYYAFSDCTSLTSITIPDSVTSIGCDTFSNTAYYNDSSNWENDVLYIGNHLIKAKDTISGDCVVKDGTKTIAAYAFYNCYSLTSVTIPDGVTSIGGRAFSYCSNLSSIAIPDTVTSIGYEVFSNTAYYNDSSNWENDVLYIGSHLIAAKESLNGDFGIKKGTKTVAGGAFYYCESLTTITIPDSVTSIGDFAFEECSALTSITIGNGVTSIGDSAFEYCNSLVSVYITDIAAWCNINFVTNPDSFYNTSNPLYYADILYLNGELISDVVIPDGVTTIPAYTFRNNKNLVSISIPNTVINIEREAFADCENLTSIIIPDSVTNIDYGAFYDCSKLTSVTLGNGIKYIDYCAFSGCNSLEAVCIKDIAAWCTIDFTEPYSNPIEYSKKLYLNGELVTDLIIPDGTTSIGVSAFESCDSLVSLSIPDSVTSIKDSAFAYCDRLTSITIGNSVKSIGYEAFYNCGSLVSVIIPDSVTSIEDSAFQSCESLASVTIGDGVTSIGNSAFYYCTALKSITIPRSVSNIGNDAFFHCWSLTDILVSKENEYFSSVDGVLFDKQQTQLLKYPEGKEATVYTIPDGVEIIDHAAFTYTSFTSVTIPNSVTTIGSEAFESCELTSITIPDSVTSIGDGAFSYCSDLETIILPDTDIFLDGNPIDNTAFYRDTNNWQDGVLYIGNHLIEADNSFSGNFVIREGTKTIAGNAFWGCEDLYSIIIPDSVTNIGSYAFSYCGGLTTITIPDNVIRIGNYVFSDCTNLTSITIPDTVTSIGYGSFSNTAYYDNWEDDWEDEWNNDWDDDVFYVGNHLIEIDSHYPRNSCKIKSGTKTIAAHAFIGNTIFANPADYGCKNIKSIVMPDSVTNVGVDAFAYCDNLKYVFYTGSESEWADITIENGNEFLTNAIIHYNSEGHVYGDWNVISEPTCIDEGLRSKKCVFCEEIISEAIPVIEHNYVDDVCSVCGKENLPESEHPYSEYCDDVQTIYKEGATNIDVTFSEDTYTESGYDKIYIYDGSDTLIGTYSGSALAGETVNVPGDTVKIRLTSDGSNQQYGYKVIKAVAKYNCIHKNVNWVVDIEATCETNGSRHSVCVDCGETVETGTIYAIGHYANGWKVDKDSTCTEEGSMHKECVECGITFENAPISKKEHTAGSWETEKKATVNNAGKKVKKCTECGEVLETAEIPQLKCSKPTLKTISNTQYGVKITWGKVKGADKYYVYRKVKGGSYSRIGSTTNTYYTDKTAKSGKKYYYIVKAINEAGASSSSSSLSKLYLADPTLKTPTSTKSGVSLKWTKTAGAEGYIIYRKTGSGSYTKLKAEKGVSNLSYVDKSAKKGKKYTYKVKAYYSKTYSAYSNTKSITDKY